MQMPDLSAKKRPKRYPPNPVYNFFASPVGKRIMKAENVKREFRFSILCQAEAYFNVPPGEEILLQGVCGLLHRGAGRVDDNRL